jgi:transcription elongation factor Elf1
MNDYKELQDDGFVKCPHCGNKAFRWIDPERAVIVIECNNCYKVFEKVINENP